MKNFFLDQLIIFIAAMTMTAYSVLSNEKAIKRNILIAKFLGAVVVSFFVMPAVMEYFNLTIKATLLITIIIIYGFESLLKTSVKRLTKIIDNDGKDISDN